MIQTYGKINPVKKLYLQFKRCFKTDEYVKQAYASKGIETYIPCRTRNRAIAGIGVNTILCSPIVPVGFALTPFVTRWCLK